MNLPTQTQKISAGTVIIDANVLVSICAQEPTCQTAEDALDDYAVKNWAFYAPGAILTETLFTLCRKQQDGSLTEAEHAEAQVVGDLFKDFGFEPPLWFAGRQCTTAADRAASFARTSRLAPSSGDR
jgi:predicted nucleic-acid-binding protein